ncbi:DNA repair protein RadC (plasmid) [Geobacter anodireducens]|nr:DNA repair protein RadC [Geobacter anodireducens]
MNLNLFGDPVAPTTKKISIRSIEARYRTEVVREDAPAWVSTRYTHPRQVFEMFLSLKHETKEHFIALHMDGKNRIVCLDRVSIGTLNQSLVHPREVFKTALLSNAAAVVLLHNHPSGDPTPSNEDYAITTRLKEGGELLGIRILDHIVIGDGCYTSFVETGNL